MRFDERFLDEIKSRVRLSDVIGKTVKLKRQGREYAGLSPFTKEKTPSFFVNDDKGFWHDFSSGKHGDLIGFLQEVERLSFPEAVERIANEAGVPLPAADPQAQEREQKKLEAETRKVEDEERAQVRKSRATLESKLKEEKNRIRLLAVLLPPLPVLGLALIIFLRKLARERESTPAQRRRRAA